MAKKDTYVRTGRDLRAYLKQLLLEIAKKEIAISRNKNTVYYEDL
jgi:hypothetical protein